VQKTASAISSLFRNISLAVVLNLLIKTAWIFANNVVQDRVGHTDFGLYLALYAFGFLFLAVSDMGINQYTTVTLAAQPTLLRKLFPSLLSLKLFFSALYPLMMLGAGWLLGYAAQELYFLFLLAAVHGILQINAFFRANFQAFQQFRIDAVASVLDRAVMLGIVCVLLLTRISVEAYIYAYLASALVTMVLLYAALSRVHGRLRPGGTWAEYQSLLRASLPFAIITVLYSVNDKIDQVMLERIIGGDAGKHETGLYGGAYRWVDTVMMYLWTVLPIFFAKFAQHRHDMPMLRKLLVFGQPIAALPMLFAGVFVLFYGDKLLFLFTQSTATELATMTLSMKILFIAVLINGLFAIYSTLLTATGHEGFVGRMIAASIVMNVTLNAFLIPHFGAIACAWATVASFSLLSVSYLWYIRFRLGMALPFGLLGKLVVVGLAFAAAFWALDASGLPWWAVSGLAAVVLAGLTFVTRLLKLRPQDD
jgi:O-antigen/teichoic acid export membrane protein